MAENERPQTRPTGILVPANHQSNLDSNNAPEAGFFDISNLERTPRPSGLRLHDSFKASFSKTAPSLGARKESLLTNALHSSSNSPTEEHIQDAVFPKAMSRASTCSNHSATTAELTSDGGFTSPATRASTPSPPLPPTTFRGMVPVFDKTSFEHPASVAHHDEDSISPLQKAPEIASGEHGVEATLGRKRCITFACGRKDARKPAVDSAKPKESAEPATEAPKRACTIKFACPTKISTVAPTKSNRPRQNRAASPAPMAYRQRASPKPDSSAHRNSDSTIRNVSPISSRKQSAVKDWYRRLSVNSDLGRTEAFRFHEFASSEDEVDEWLQESTCHRSRLTVSDTLKIENNLRQLGEEVEEEALDEDEELDDDNGDDDADLDDEDDDGDHDGVDEDLSSDEGFRTDDEEGFAGSDDESDAGSDFNWWAPGAYSTAATSVELLEHIRPSGSRRSISESSMGSVGSIAGFKMPQRSTKRKKSRPVNIRIPTPELPDSTDFVCGTLDEDRPLEDAYMSCLERRRAAKHKATPQDIDPTFPTSDPEMDEEDEDDEPDRAASESDHFLMMHGRMDPVDGDSRGRSAAVPPKRSPAQSPKRLRSPPPVKRTAHRSPPPRKLFGTSPRRLRSPAPATHLKSPPPTRRESTTMLPARPAPTIRFGGLGERPALVTSSSLPRTPISTHPSDDLDDEDTCREMPIRRAIDIKIGLETKRQRRKEQLYKKMQRKGGKEKRPAPGKGCERMREMGLGLAAYKGKTAGFAFGIPPTPDQKDMHVLSL